MTDALPALVGSTVDAFVIDSEQKTNRRAGRAPQGVRPRRPRPRRQRAPRHGRVAATETRDASAPSTDSGRKRSRSAPMMSVCATRESAETSSTADFFRHMACPVRWVVAQDSPPGATYPLPARRCLGAASGGTWVSPTHQARGRRTGTPASGAGSTRFRPFSFAVRRRRSAASKTSR